MLPDKFDGLHLSPDHLGDTAYRQLVALLALSIPYVDPGAPVVGAEVTSDAGPAIYLGADFPLALRPGDSLVVSVDGGADETATVDGTAGYFEPLGGAPHSLADGQWVEISVDGGPARRFTVDEDDYSDVGGATDAELAAALNRDLPGVRVFVAGGKVRVASDTFGTASSVARTAGSGAGIGAGGFWGAPVAGTGDAADVGAMTLAEAAALIESAVDDVKVTSVDGALAISTTAVGADVSLEVKAGTAAGFGVPDDVSGTGEAVVAGMFAVTLPAVDLSAWGTAPSDVQRRLHVDGGTVVVDEAAPATDADVGPGAVDLIVVRADDELPARLSISPLNAAGPTRVVEV